jgi:hypothetical protein
LDYSILRQFKLDTTNYLYTQIQYKVMTNQAYAAHKADGKLEPFEYELGSLKPDEVEVDIEYCGICHSDLHCSKMNGALHGIHL